ncbi:hypothetical protein NG702_04815 [Pseudarthrobacter sp. MDT3-28]|uniref:hypothetical protein n=1 Tax=Pseudarthrobacter raffinosi TaxID=2953651 RepID=UPI00208EB85C|nr:hypothetical protein [Pseudarthrobacter sp. MDT3-28]MCO4236752.1 hypothetical protein [Pseudarthrobacter sp. MDT3-28]
MEPAIPTRSLALSLPVDAAVVPSAALGSDPATGSIIRTVFLPLVMSAIAVTSHIVAGALYRQRQAWSGRTGIWWTRWPRAPADSGCWTLSSPQWE